MANFIKFKLECLFFCCFDSAIWLTLYTSCLLVSAWLGRSIAFFSVFRISQSESNLAKETGVCEPHASGWSNSESTSWSACSFVASTRRFGSRCIPPVCWSRLGIAFFSVFRISQSESNLAENLESVNARKWMVEFGKYKLGCLFFCCVNVEG